MNTKQTPAREEFDKGKRETLSNILNVATLGVAAYGLHEAIKTGEDIVKVRDGISEITGHSGRTADATERTVEVGEQGIDTLKRMLSSMEKALNDMKTYVADAEKKSMPVRKPSKPINAKETTPASPPFNMMFDRSVMPTSGR